MVPVGETSVGTGGSGTLTVMLRGVLRALVPAVFVAFTDQLYAVPFTSAVDGVTEHAPVPLAQPAAVAVKLVEMKKPVGPWTMKPYEFAPDTAFQV